MGDLIMVIAAVVFVVAFFFALKAYVSLKSVGTGLTALAVKEFHEACDSLLKTPDELPEEVLKALKGMGRSALAKNSHWHLRNAIRRDRTGKSVGPGNPELQRAVEGMRPELKKLFFKATASWLNIICNRSIAGSIFIQLEMHKLQIQSGATNSNVAEKEAMRVLPKVGACTT